MRLHSSCVPPLAPASLAAAPFVCILLCALARFGCTFEASLSVPAVAPTGARTHDRRDPKANALTAALSRVWLSFPARGRTSTVCIATSCAHGPVSQRAPPSRSAMRVRACVCLCVCVCVCVCAFAETSFFSLASWSGPRAALCLQLAVPPTDHHQPEPSFLHQKGNHYKHIRGPHRLVVRFDSFVPRLPFTRCWASTQRNFCQQSSSNKTGAGPAKCGC